MTNSAFWLRQDQFLINIQEIQSCLVEQMQKISYKGDAIQRREFYSYSALIQISDNFLDIFTHWLRTDKEILLHIALVTRELLHCLFKIVASNFTRLHLVYRDNSFRIFDSHLEISKRTGLRIRSVVSMQRHNVFIQLVLYSLVNRENSQDREATTMRLRQVRLNNVDNHINREH